MATEASNPGFAAGQIEELQRENAQLKEQLRRLAAQQTVVGGALSEAMHEKETTARLAHQVAVEERATRAAVEVQGNNVGFAVILQIITFFMLLILMFGLFMWLPDKLAEATPRSSTTYVQPAAPVQQPAPVIVPR